MMEWLRREAIYLWYYLDIQIRQIAPYWALGILLGSAVSVFGKRYIHGAFAKIGQRRMGWLGVIPASLLGIASPLCMYGTIPIAASFSEQGVKDDYLAAFMMSSILLKSALLTVAWNADDWTFDALIAHYKTLVRYIHFRDMGMVLGYGCGTPSMTRSSGYPEEAYRLGKSL